MASHPRSQRGKAKELADSVLDLCRTVGGTVNKDELAAVMNKMTTELAPYLQHNPDAATMDSAISHGLKAVADKVKPALAGSGSAAAHVAYATCAAVLAVAASDAGVSYSALGAFSGIHRNYIRTIGRVYDAGELLLTGLRDVTSLQLPRAVIETVIHAWTSDAHSTRQAGKHQISKKVFNALTGSYDTDVSHLVLNCDAGDVYKSWQKEYPLLNCGYSKFMQLRPSNVKNPRTDSCVCGQCMEAQDRFKSYLRLLARMHRDALDAESKVGKFARDNPGVIVCPTSHCAKNPLLERATANDLTLSLAWHGELPQGKVFKVRKDVDLYEAAVSLLCDADTVRSATWTKEHATCAGIWDSTCDKGCGASRLANECPALARDTTTFTHQSYGVWEHTFPAQGKHEAKTQKIAGQKTFKDTAKTLVGKLRLTLKNWFQHAYHKSWFKRYKEELDVYMKSDCEFTQKTRYAVYQTDYAEQWAAQSKRQSQMAFFSQKGITMATATGYYYEYVAGAAVKRRFAFVVFTDLAKKSAALSAAVDDKIVGLLASKALTGGDLEFVTRISDNATVYRSRKTYHHLAKPRDGSARSRMKNVYVFGVPEEGKFEGDSLGGRAKSFLTKLLQRMQVPIDDDDVVFAAADDVCDDDSLEAACGEAQIETAADCVRVCTPWALAQFGKPNDTYDWCMVDIVSPADVMANKLPDVYPAPAPVLDQYFATVLESGDVLKQKYPCWCAPCLDRKYDECKMRSMSGMDSCRFTLKPKPEPKPKPATTCDSDSDSISDGDEDGSKADGGDGGAEREVEQDPILALPENEREVLCCNRCNLLRDEHAVTRQEHAALADSSATKPPWHFISCSNCSHGVAENLIHWFHGCCVNDYLGLAAPILSALGARVEWFCSNACERKWAVREAKNSDSATYRRATTNGVIEVEFSKKRGQKRRKGE